MAGYEAVNDSPDFRRVFSLPRRELDLQFGEALSDKLTPLLARRPGPRLRPLQALALWELRLYRGLFLGMPVGEGKTLLSFLFPRVCELKRPWLVIPGGARQSTQDKFRALMAGWHCPQPPPLIRSFEELAVESSVDLLEREQPDGVFFDEGDRLRSWDIAATKRFDRYRVEHPECVFVVATGTPSRGSLLNYAHLLLWCLRGRAPVPLDPEELRIWASALDDRPRMRAAVGAFAQLGGVDLASARRVYRERLTQTPGVIIANGTECAVPLTVRFVAAPADAVLEQHFEVFRKTMKNPDDRDVSDPLSRLAFADELGSGIYRKWDPRPPEWYVEARRNFCRFVRAQVEVTADSVSPLDTTAAVANAFRSHPVVKAWREAKKAFGEPNSVTVWLSGSVVSYAAAWLRAHPKGIAWTPHVPVGQAIAAASGTPYFGQLGKDALGRSINDWRGPCVASLLANRRERNLQHWHHQNLLVGCPSSSEIVEQVFGRTHRSLQALPVEVEVLVTCRETREAFDKAVAEAKVVEAREGLAQKVLRAQVERLSLDAARNNTYRFGVT